MKHVKDAPQEFKDFYEISAKATAYCWDDNRIPAIITALQNPAGIDSNTLLNHIHDIRRLREEFTTREARNTAGALQQAARAMTGDNSYNFNKELSDFKDAITDFVNAGRAIMELPGGDARGRGKWNANDTYDFEIISQAEVAPLIPLLVAIQAQVPAAPE